jgi:hypothetical protein
MTATKDLNSAINCWEHGTDTSSVVGVDHIKGPLISSWLR